jgi:hypothetical protein
VRGTFRLRVTATIESDETLYVERDETVQSGVAAARMKMLRNAGRFRSWSNSAGNSVLRHAYGAAAQNRDDTGAARAFVRRFVFANRTRRISGAPVIPWIDETWRPGDRVRGIEPRGVRFESVAGFASYPEVVGIEYSASPPTTRLVLEDWRLVE